MLPGHQSRNCQSKYKCSVCSRSHSKFIHISLPNEREKRDNTGDISRIESQYTCSSIPAKGCSANTKTNSNVVLPIVPVKINDDNNVYYALLDSGSTHTLINRDLTSNLELISGNANYTTHIVASQSKIDKIVSFDLDSIDGAGKIRVNNVLVVNQIPACFPSKTVDFNDYIHLKDLPLDHLKNDKHVSMTVGMDKGHLLMPYEMRIDPKGENTLFGWRSYFGWTVGGFIGKSHHEENVFSCFVKIDTIENQIERLWEMETDIKSSESGMSANDLKVCKHQTHADDLRHAENMLIIDTQKCEFAVEIDKIKQGKPVPKSSCIVKLDPILQDGVLIVGGRCILLMLISR